MARKPINLAGQRFGRLLAVEATDRRTESGDVIWRCRCDCGREREFSAHVLRSGNTRSCGCGSDENRSGFFERWKPRLDAGTLEEAAWARRNAEVEIYDPYLVAHGRPPTSEEEFLDALKKALKKEEER